MRRLLSRLGSILVLATITGPFIGTLGRALPGAEKHQPPAAFAQTPSGDYSLLLELAQSLLGPGLAANGQANGIQILPGALPSDLPLSLPQPSSSRLVGSVVRSFPAGESWGIVLDAPGSVSDLLSFYGTSLTGLGWTPPAATGPSPTGFQPSSAPSGPGAANPGGGPGNLPAGLVTLCQSSSHQSLVAAVFPGANGTNNVQIQVGPDAPGPCSPPPILPSMSLLPALSALGGVQVQPLASAADPGRASSEAIASTNSASGDLATSYAQQLSTAGWTQTAAQDDGAMAWSTWALPAGGDWQGYLSARSAGQGQQVLYIEVFSPSQELQALTPPPSGSGG